MAMTDGLRSLKVGRRELLIGSLAATLPILPRFASFAAGPSAGWPSWAPTRESLYARLDAAAGEARDVRSFGARLDGRTDDSDALQRAIDSGARELLIPSAPAGQGLRLTRPVRIAAPISLIGSGDNPAILWEGTGPAAFIATLGDDPTRYLTDIRFDRLVFARVGQADPIPVALRCVNVRGVSFTRCTTRNMGGLYVTHVRQEAIDRKTVGAAGEDPSIAAGFSAKGYDDLCEDIFVYDNKVDAGAYTGDVVRLNFVRRAAAVGNVGRFAKISWWGGGAKRLEGGDPRFLRRARDFYIVGNRLSGSNGGVYGNNGQNIYVGRNEIELMTDVGIDFEGCFDCLAEQNSVRNVGNFCLATFYAARNIVFRNNVAVQDGSGTNLHLRFGKGKFGAMKGRALFGMISAGYKDVPDAIDVALFDNRLSWQGPRGVGTFAPSFFNRLTVERNQLENVTCNLAFSGSGELRFVNNRLNFTQAAETPVDIIASQAARTIISDNVVTLAAGQPAGSAGIFVRPTPKGGGELEVARNRIASADGALPIVLMGNRRALAIRDNEADAIYAAKALEEVRGNRNRSGKAVALAPPPAMFKGPRAKD